MAPFPFGVCITCGSRSDEPLDFFCTDGAAAERVWSWKTFRFIDTTTWATSLQRELIAIFSADPDVELLSTTLEALLIPREGSGRKPVLTPLLRFVRRKSH